MIFLLTGARRAVQCPLTDNKMQRTIHSRFTMRGIISAASAFHLAAVVLAACLTVPCAAPAIEFLQEDVFTVAEDEFVEKETWVSAGRVEIAGTAEQDLFLLASGESDSDENKSDGVILLNGRCADDVWAIGTAIELPGEISGSARLLGRSIEISGLVAESGMFLGNSVRLTKTGVCEGGLLAVGENVLLEGRVLGDATVTAVSVTLSGEFGGNVTLISEDISLSPGTSIAGDLIYRSKTEMPPAPGVIVGGEIKHEPYLEETNGGVFNAQALIIQAILYLGALIAGAAAIKIFPSKFAAAAEKTGSATAKSLLTGFAACALMALLGFFALVSIVGAPLGALALSAAAALFYLGKIPVAIFIGRLLLRRPRRTDSAGGFGALAIGLLAVYFAAALPMAGAVAGLLAAFTGMGALISAIFTSKAEPRPGAEIQT